MANVNVTYDEMRHAGTRLETGEADMNTKLNELQNFIQNLISTGFVTDSASVSFGEAYNQFTTSTRKGLEALTQMSTYLNNAATRLQETDQSLSVSFG